MRSNIDRVVPSARCTMRATQPEPENLSEWLREGYQELRRIAAHLFHYERSDHTLQATALVHEAFLRLAERGPQKYDSRAHFFGVAARAMRQILIEHARGHGAQKRAGVWHKVPLKEAALVGVQGPDFVALDDALTRLEQFAPRQGRIVELRFFGGLSTGEVAAILGRGKSTIRRDWRIARAWLQREIESASE